MLKLERKYYSSEVKAIVGVDEAGRGPLAGPVYAAAVVFPRGYKNKEINDSKKLSAKKREELFEVIKQHALGYGIASVSADEIDTLNIYEATKVCMSKAIEQIQCPYQLILTDAMPLSGQSCPVVPIIKGDAQCLNIAAASILAKVARDRSMVALHDEFPVYGFDVHKGYPTPAHLAALAAHGPCPHHRRSFAPVREAFARGREAVPA